MGSRGPGPAMAAALVALLCLAPAARAYSVGDFVPMQRRGQYHSMRMHWHDALGRHCPHFAVDREARGAGETLSGRDLLSPGCTAGRAPRAQARGVQPRRAVQAFGKERFVTPWLFVLGRKGPDIPVVDVTLAHFAGELRGAKAQVAPMPSKYLHLHPDIAQHYHNDSSWPKHILLRYTWKEQAEMDSKAGLYVLFGSAFAMTTTLALYILQSSKEKIARFMNEHVVSTPVPGTEIAKVE
eukprot:SM000314S12174  [mRNA]  locus=s314:94888:96880:+ [translate_table: standard]